MAVDEPGRAQRADDEMTLSRHHQQEPRHLECRCDDAHNHDDHSAAAVYATGLRATVAFPDDWAQW